MECKNYKQAQALLTGRCKNRRKLANNTYLERRSWNRIAVRLHNTDVVTYIPGGRARLDSGGWETVTTKDRINRFSFVTLWQEKNVWYVAKPGEKKFFYNGMTIDEHGWPI